MTSSLKKGSGGISGLMGIARTLPRNSDCEKSGLENDNIVLLRLGLRHLSFQ
jgi:hypothetical protein